MERECKPGRWTGEVAITVRLLLLLLFPLLLLRLVLALLGVLFPPTLNAPGFMVLLAASPPLALLPPPSRGT